MRCGPGACGEEDVSMQEGHKAPETKDDELRGPDMASVLVYSDPPRRP